MQTIDSKKLSPLILLSSSTHIYYKKDFQFKNATCMTDKFWWEELSCDKSSNNDIGAFN